MNPCSNLLWWWRGLRARRDARYIQKLAARVQPGYEHQLACYNYLDPGQKVQLAQTMYKQLEHVDQRIATATQIAHIRAVRKVWGFDVLDPVTPCPRCHDNHPRSTTCLSHSHYRRVIKPEYLYQGRF